MITMQHVKRAALPLVALFALAASGCATFAVHAPSGYVALEKTQLPYKAVSADGAVLAVRVYKNRPRATLSFWSQVLHRELLARRGYKLTAQRPVQARGVAGVERTYLTEIDGRAHVHVVALFIAGDTIFCVEATTEKEAFESQRGAISSFIKSFRPLT